MAEQINPITGVCDCVDCVAARYDAALVDVCLAKVELADAYLEQVSVGDSFLSTAMDEHRQWAEDFATANAKVNTAIDNVRRLQDVANARLDALVARRREAEGAK